MCNEIYEELIKKTPKWIYTQNAIAEKKVT